MLLGLYEVMRRESRGEMRRLVRMPRANDLGSAGRMIPGDTIRASIADGVIDRRDSIAFLDRHARPIGAQPNPERLDPPTHLMTGHDPAPSELALPHMHFRTANVGLSNRRNQSASNRRRNLVFMK